MQPATVIVFPPFRLDCVSERLWRGEQPIHLRPKTFAVLRCLLEHPGQLLTKVALLDMVWPATVVSEAVLLGCIRDLRRALGDDPKHPQFIQTVHRRGYRFIGAISMAPELRAQSEVVSATPAPPTELLATREDGVSDTMVGREAELAALHRYLDTARSGRRQVVFVTGEAGLGKTTLVESFVTAVRHVGSVWIARGQCIDHFGAGEPYMPVLEALEQLCRAPQGSDLVALLAQQAPTWLVQMPWLLSPPDLERLQRALHGTTRERMLREMAHSLEILTSERPLVLVLEDLHWSDHATLDLLAMLARRQEPAKLLVLGTYRLEEVVGRGHPLQTVTQELRLHGHCAEVPLSLLSESAVATYVQSRLPQTPRAEDLVRFIHQRTDGNPLFMVNIVDEVISRNLEGIDKRQWIPPVQQDASEHAIPENLRQLLAQRFEQLQPEEQRVLEVGSVVGVEFASALVAAGLDTEVEQAEAMYTLAFLAYTLWLLGYPDQAVARAEEAVLLAQRLEHPANLIFALHYVVRMHRWHGDQRLAQEYTEVSLTLAAKYGFTQLVAQGTFLLGLLLTEQGQDEKGLALMRQGLEDYRTTGARIRLPMYLADLAAGYAKARQIDAGLIAVSEALTHVKRTAERWYEAEIYRLQGVLLLLRSDDHQPQAEACYHHALDIARHQHAKSWELRAAISLARLWQSKSKRQEAYDLIAPVSGWFSEGFDTPDVQEAQRLLYALA